MNLDRRGFLGTIAGTAATVLVGRSASAAVVYADAAWAPWAGTNGVPLAADSPFHPNEITPTSLSGGAELANTKAPALLSRALAALNTHAGRVTDRNTIGIVDFSLPSNTPRFHIVDLAGGKVISTHLVAHGRGSDPANVGRVEHLSNRLGSEASCSGSFVLGETYVGHHGRSRRLHGLDPENDQAEVRGIVIHSASYVDSSFLAAYGRIGRSQGCFAVGHGEIEHVLDQLGPGRLLFAAR